MPIATDAINLARSRTTGGPNSGRTRRSSIAMGQAGNDRKQAKLKKAVTMGRRQSVMMSKLGGLGSPKTNLSHQPVKMKIVGVDTPEDANKDTIPSNRI